MGASLSHITSTRLFAVICERQGRAVWCWVVGWGTAFTVRGHVWLKGVAFLMIAAAGLPASAMEKELLSERGSLTETKPETVARAEVVSEPSKIAEFVLAEVRRRLDPNPETEIVELKIDPDYRGAKETYLVNAVLDAHGRKLMVGVLVTVKQTSEGLQAAVEYIH